jgi:hypothetical protein
LLAKHREEGREEGNGKAREENRLDMNHRWGRPSPSREGGDIVSEGSVVDLVNKNAEESSSFVTGVGPQMGVDLDDEGRGHSREQTGLMT